MYIYKGRLGKRIAVLTIQIWTVPDGTVHLSHMILRRRMHCIECGVELTAGSMTVNHLFMHGTELAIDWNQLLVSQTEYHPQAYGVRFPQTKKRRPWPFPGCTGYSCTWCGLCSHFSSQNWGGSTRIPEEHPNPLPKCEFCRGQVPGGRLNNRHYASDNCKHGEEQRIWCETLQFCFGEIGF